MTPLTDVEKIRRLPWLLTAEAFNAAFCILTFAGTVFLLFLDELGLNEGQIGFLLSLIPFCGIVAPFIAPGVARFGYKRVYVTFWGIRKFVLALARIAGDERYYMQQWRALQANPATATAQAMLALQKLTKQAGCNRLTSLAGACAESFAQGNLAHGATLLAEFINLLPQTRLDPTLGCILSKCAHSLTVYGATRIEFVLLSLHTLHLALHQLNSTRTGRSN